MEVQTHKACPFCGEEVLIEAVKCKHCQSNIDQNQPPANDYGVLLTCTPLAASFLIIYWVGGMSVIESPGRMLTLIMIGVVILTSFWAYEEAKNKPEANAGTLVLGMFFLWALAYPIHMYRRKSYGLSNLVVAGVVSTLVFVVSSVIMSGAISLQQEKMNEAMEELGRAAKEVQELSEQMDQR